MWRRPLSVCAIIIVLIVLGVQQSALACRCWVGDTETTDAERIEMARAALNQTHYAVIGQIQPISSSDDNGDDDSLYLSRHDAAVISVEEAIDGDPPQAIYIPENAGNGIYYGELRSLGLGSCGMSWENGERNLWLILQDDAGNLVLANYCAHSLVRNWLFPEFSDDVTE